MALIQNQPPFRIFNVLSYCGQDFEFGKGHPKADVFRQRYC
jgi:hypothetical protein